MGTAADPGWSCPRGALLGYEEGEPGWRRRTVWFTRGGTVNAFVPIALWAFVPLAVLAFAGLPPRRAVLGTLLGGWLFLPHFNGRYHWLFLHEKAAFVPAIVLAASLVFHLERWGRLRPHPLDLPVVALCAQAFATALQNDLGSNEAISSTLQTGLTLGAPYLLGRVYFGTPPALGDLARGIVTAALVYLPLCLWEMRMAPTLHYLLYGFAPYSFVQALRFGGYRPSVFMQHGLALAMFMAAGTLLAYWLWRTRARASLGGVGLGWIFGALLVTTVLTRSAGAIVLLAAGIGALESVRALRTHALVLLLAVTPATYCAARVNGWSGATAIAAARAIMGDERAGSLEYRIKNEDLLIEKALGRPWLGWGRWGRSFVYDEDGRSVGAVTDGMWIIALGMRGLFGLAAFGALLALPVFAFLRLHSARATGCAPFAAQLGLGVVTLLWAVDSLMNAMPTPIFPAILGGLASFVQASAAARRARTARARWPAVQRGDASVTA